MWGFRQAYLFNDDDFNYNYGMAKTAAGHYKDAEEHLQVQFGVVRACASLPTERVLRS